MHLTDIHLDLHYLPKSLSSASCHRQRPVAQPKPPDQGDVPAPKPTDRVGGVYGAPLTGCDSPASLLEFTLSYIRENILDLASNPIDDGSTLTSKETEPAPLSFVVWTGDSARHDSDKLIKKTWDENFSLIHYVTAELNELFVDHLVPVIPSIGNNGMSNSVLCSDRVYFRMILFRFSCFSWRPSFIYCGQ
jgi:endopolyphosphatase